MGVKLILEIQCDVCGREMDEKYPPTIYAQDAQFADADVLWELRDVAARSGAKQGWSWNSRSKRLDAWGKPIIFRCHQCRDERRWE